MAKSIVTEEKKTLLLNPKLVKAVKEVPNFQAWELSFKLSKKLTTTVIQRRAIAKSIFWSNIKLASYIRFNKSLPYLESDKAWMVLRLYQFGTKLFGTEERFDRWMRSPCGALHNEIPYELLRRHNGFFMVEQDVLKIAAGAFA